MFTSKGRLISGAKTPKVPRVFCVPFDLGPSPIFSDQATPPQQSGWDYVDTNADEVDGNGWELEDGSHDGDENKVDVVDGS